MKSKKSISMLISFFFAAIILATSCKVKTVNSNPNGIPPGQAKKITGSQSAKPYAPGQQKK